MPFRVSRQVAISSKRRPRPSEPASQPAGVKRNHTDLHIMIYIPVLCLFLLSSRLLPPRPPSPSPLPPPSCLAPLFCLFFTSCSSILSFSPSPPLSVWTWKNATLLDVWALSRFRLRCRCYSCHATIVSLRTSLSRMRNRKPL